jgi:hypothetical protein
MKYNTPSACRQRRVEFVHIKSKRGHNNMLDTVNYWT